MKTMRTQTMKTMTEIKTSEAIMKNVGKTFFTLSLSVLTAVVPVFASGNGTSGAQFLRIGAGARAMGMAGAFSPIADDATAIYWNPAGMAMMEKKEVALSYNAYIKDSAAQFAGYAHPTADIGTWGLGVSLFPVNDIEKRSITAGDTDTPDGGLFKTQDMAVSLGWANKFGMGSGRMSIGIAAKYISSDLNTKSAATGALDLGTIYNFREDGGFGLSLAVLNLGGELKFDKKGDPLPLDIKPGLSWRQDMGRMKLNAALDSDLLVHDNKATVQPGLELWVHPSMALRGGYQLGRGKGAGSGMGAGLGLRIVNLNIDYAFVPFGDLGDTHRMSLGLKF